MLPVLYVALGVLGVFLATDDSKPAPTTGHRNKCRRCKRAPCKCVRAVLHRSPIYSCGQFPWLPEDVDHVLQVLTDDGVCGEADLTRRTLQEIYPHTPEGKDLRWPSVPGDCVQIRAIEGRVAIRAGLAASVCLDSKADAAWEEGGGR